MAGIRGLRVRNDGGRAAWGAAKFWTADEIVLDVFT
jgi:hypothetical protein